MEGRVITAKMIAEFKEHIILVGMSKTSPKTKGRREKEGGDYPTKRKSA